MRFAPPGAAPLAMVLLLWTACKTDLPNASYRCERTSDCPTGFLCDPKLLLCVRYSPELGARLDGQVGGAAAVSGREGQAGEPAGSAAGASGSAGSGGSAEPPQPARAGSAAAGTDPVGTMAPVGGEPNGIAQAGARCSTASQRACAGHGSNQVLECDGAAWQPAPACEGGSLCDSVSPAHLGRCRPVVPECSGNAADTTVCIGSTLHQCGIDGVTVKVDRSCGPGMTCSDGACECATKCDGECVDHQTSAEHCGRCGHSCGAAGCAMGLCNPEMLAQGKNTINSLEVNDLGVFWIDLDEYFDWNESSTGTLIRMGFDGKNPLALLTDGSDAHAPSDLALDDRNVYMIRGDNHVLKLAPDGSSERVLSDLAVDGWFFTVAGGYVYYSGPATQAIVRVSVDGGSPEVIVAEATAPDLFVVDGEYLYWTDYQAYTINRVPVRGGTSSVLVTEEAVLRPFFVKAGNLYWSAERSRKLKMRSVEGGATTVLLEDLVNDVVADDTHLYLNAGASVTRIPLGGGAVERLSDDFGVIYAFAEHGDYVYLATREATVYRVRK
jgi:hypothetical protein